MKLYYLTGACSLASNISLREAGIPFEAVKVERPAWRTADGLDYTQINPKRVVPALALDNREILTENVAVLPYIADRNPAAKLIPPAGSMERYRLLEWLGFINSDVHRSFSVLFRKDTPPETREAARGTLERHLGYLERAIGARTFLMGEQFSVVDAYLFTVLSWSSRVDIDLGRWPALKRYVERIRQRPNVVAALQSEGLLK